MKPNSGTSASIPNLCLLPVPDEHERGWLITWGRLTRHPGYHLVVFVESRTGVCTFADVVDADPAGQLHQLLEKCAGLRDMPQWIAVDAGVAWRDTNLREWCARNRIHLRREPSLYRGDSALRTQLKLSMLLGGPGDEHRKMRD